MPQTVVLNPKITAVGSAAAISQNGLGLTLAIDHVAFGTGAYNPTGSETALQTEVKRLTIPAGSLVTPTQARITAIWESVTDNYAINEIGFFAGSTLFAVWSRATGGPIGYKTPGVDFVLFHDLKISGVPAGSVSIQVEETAGSIALAALGAHEAAADPHNGYVRKALLPDANAFLACAVTGTANALVLTLPTGVTPVALTTYQKVIFIATAANTGAMTANVAGGGVKNIKKGASAMVSGDIQAGGIYELTYDGIAWQINGIIGSPITQAFADARYAQLAAAQSFTKAQRGAFVALTSASASIAVDLSLANNFSHTLTENTTLAAPSNAVAGQAGVIELVQHASAAKTLAYNTFWKFADGIVPSVTTTLSGNQKFFYVVDAGGASATCVLMNVRS